MTFVIQTSGNMSLFISSRFAWQDVVVDILGPQEGQHYVTYQEIQGVSAELDGVN